MTLLLPRRRRADDAPKSWFARRRNRVIAIPAALAAVAGGLAVPAAHALRADVTVAGLPDLVGKAALSNLSVRVQPHAASTSAVHATLDGVTLSGARENHAMVYRLQGLADGRHTFTARVSRSYGLGSVSVSRSFTVDTVPPALSGPASLTLTAVRAPVTIRGTVESGATLTANDQHVDVSNGSYAVTIPAPAPALVRLIARDAAGNTTERDVTVYVTHPLMRAVHMTELGWSADFLRNPVLALARAHKINTIEVDIKDEDGVIGFPSTLPLAREIGAASHIYDVHKIVAQLHTMHIRLVGRLVCFRDPKLAQWAWSHGHHDMVVIDKTTGQPWAGRYGHYSFTNFANPIVQKYNADLAAEAARLGFDDVLFDYVRRPDGPIARMFIPGLHGTPETAVANFVKLSRPAVRAAGAYLGASVFGVSATRPKEVAQNIPEIAPYVDYVSPMVYPSHWANGEYNVPNPNAQPYDIVFRSLKDFVRDTRGTGAQVIPWLQDFSLYGVHYGVPQVQAQITAAHNDHIQGFLLWNAGSSYQGGALAVLPKQFWAGV